MSALGHYRGFRQIGAIADIRQHDWDVRLFNHLVGDGKHARRNGEVDPLGSTEVDDKFEFGWRLNWHVCWFFALEDAIDVACRAAVLVDWVGGIRDQTAVSNEETAEVDRRQFMSSGKRNDLFPEDR